MVEVGQRFGRLIVLELMSAAKRRQARVKCDCGNEKLVAAGNLTSGHTRSCGCLHSERMREVHTKHGHRRDGVAPSPTYEAWCTMVRNCSNPVAKQWEYYGRLGVTVCERWLGEEGYEHFVADLGERPSDDHVLSRRNKQRGFTPSNAYWATRHETNRNKVNNTMYTVGSRTQCLVDWAKEYGIPKATLHYRVVTKGMTMRDALDVGRGRSGKVLPG